MNESKAKPEMGGQCGTRYGEVVEEIGSKETRMEVTSQED